MIKAGPLMDLAMALQESIEDTDKGVSTDEGEKEVHLQSKPPPKTWAQRWLTAPSPGFLAESREKRFLRENDQRGKPPPTGTYNCKYGMTDPATRSTLLNPRGKFGGKTRSVKLLAEEKRVEDLMAKGQLDPMYGKIGTATEEIEFIPDKRSHVRGPSKTMDFGKFPDRKPLITQEFIVQNYLTSYEQGVVNGDLLLSTSKHVAAADFTKAAKRPAQEYTSFFQVGQ